MLANKLGPLTVVALLIASPSQIRGDGTVVDDNNPTKAAVRELSFDTSPSRGTPNESVDMSTCVWGVGVAVFFALAVYCCVCQPWSNEDEAHPFEDHKSFVPVGVVREECYDGMISAEKEDDGTVATQPDDDSCLPDEEMFPV